MSHSSRSFSQFIGLLLLITFFDAPSWAQQNPQASDDKQTKQERRQSRRARRARAAEANANPTDKPAANGNNSAAAETVEISADRQSKTGDLFVYEGYVNAEMGEMRVQADRITYNDASGDMVAEGNVIFDEGSDQRVTARRAEINWLTRKGIFWETTGFTNRTQTGEYIYFTAARVEKISQDTYELYDASVTACEDTIPKWTFTVKRAELKVEDRLTLRRPVFRIKGYPAFALPYAWIPATSSERKSGFLLPTTGSSNQKGRTFKTAYYQTLGPSADITFRNDIYTARGLGFGAEFRAQTDERSYMRLGTFTVKDRLFGEAGEDQGGTAFVADGVQYLPRGWLAVGNVSIVTSLRFRQAFSDDISQVVDPRRESTFYVNNNTGNVSFNFLAANETTTIFRPDASASPELPPRTGTNFDIKIRQAPQIELNIYPRRVKENLPIYFSLDSSIGALKREETVDDQIVLITPAAVQRLDLQPKITVPLATIGGFAVTPTLMFRQTFYSNSLDRSVPLFNPTQFAVLPSDPRLNPAREEFDPEVLFFDRTVFDPISGKNLSRNYLELDVDIRPPSMEKTFLHDNGSRRFKHVIEPYLTYRLIKGINKEFEEIIRFDERDAIANTNEFEYALVNRFFRTLRTSELRNGRARRKAREPEPMDPLQIEKEKRKKKKGAKEATDEATDEAKAASKKTNEPLSQSDDKKPKLQTGEQTDWQKATAAQKARREANPTSADPDDPNAPDDADDSAVDSPAQAYEFFSVKIAQKYFIDRSFGGALIAGRRNQFYPINTLSGFTFGGVARDFSPLHVQIRYRPLSTIFTDVRMDVGMEDKGVRNLTLSGGYSNDKFLVSARYNLSRRIDLSPTTFEPGTFAGNQLSTTFQYGDEAQGFYAGTRIGYDFTDRFNSKAEISTGRFRNSRSFFGYQWDCCGVQFNYNTFKAGLRNESAFSFTFNLAGLGSFGTEQFSQLGGGQGGRRRGQRARRDPYENF